MKIQKGQAGYLSARKKQLGIQSALAFGVVFLILAAGYIINHTRLNVFTVVAVVGCLPATNFLVGFLTIFPHKTVEKKVAGDICEKATLLTTAYDLVITSKEKRMQVDALVISNHTVFGYTKNPKTDTEETAHYIKGLLAKNGISKSTVKIFAEYVPFLSRAEGLNNIIEVNHSSDKELELAIRNMLLTNSL